MKAQAFYDWREATEEISGADLHEFFEAVLGDPSPSGHTNISVVSIAEAPAWAMEIYQAVARAARSYRYQVQGRFGRPSAERKLL